MTEIFICDGVEELWEEKKCEGYSFYRASDKEPSTPVKDFTMRLSFVLQSIMGEHFTPTLEGFESIEPPCGRISSGQTTMITSWRTSSYEGLDYSEDNEPPYPYCCDKYMNPYQSAYENWIRVESSICKQCDSTEFCLCGNLIRRRTFIRHIETGKILCVGVDCVRKFNAELADSMENMKCLNVMCNNPLVDKRGSIWQRTEYVCSLECLRVKNANHILLKKCLVCSELVIRNGVSRKGQDYCSVKCKLNSDAEKELREIINCPCGVNIQKKNMPRHIKSKRHLARTQEVELCRCGKYFIHATFKGGVCLPCVYINDGERVPPEVIKDMIKDGLKYE